MAFSCKTFRFLSKKHWFFLSINSRAYILFLIVGRFTLAITRKDIRRVVA